MTFPKVKTAFGIILISVFILSVAELAGHTADIEEGLSSCAAITDDAARLKCFDGLTKNLKPSNDAAVTAPGGKTSPPESAIALEATTPQAPAPDEKYFSVMEKHWDMSIVPDEESNIFVLWPYRPCYILPAAYNSSPNENAQLDIDPDARAQYNEVKFQLSFKFKIWEDLFRGLLKDKVENATGIRGVDIWIGYTQQSFWQLYNSAFSAPFRDTNYEPELLFNLRIQHDIPGLAGTKLQFINVGFNHQSNGRSRPLSRSWNRIVANVGLEKIFGAEKTDSFGLLLKTWYRLPENDEDDDNPDLTENVGYGEIWGTLYWKKQRVALMLRNNLRSENKGAIQLDWSFPLPLIGDKVSGYLQYFNGYGEGLLDYNTSINRFSAGFMLTDWR